MVIDVFPISTSIELGDFHGFPTFDEPSQLYQGSMMVRCPGPQKMLGTPPWIFSGKYWGLPVFPPGFHG